MSLLAWYPLNGDLKEYSGYSRYDKDATNYGAVLDAAGKIGQCYSFGSNAYVLSELITAPKSITLAAWVYPTDLTTLYDSLTLRGVISNHDHPNTSNFSLCLRDSKISVEMGYTDGTRGTAITGSASLVVNKWQHIAFTYHYNSQRGRTYLNGVLDNEATIAKQVKVVNFPFIIGNWASTYVGHYGFIGKINDARAYSEELSKKEIYELAKAKILHYDFRIQENSTTNTITNPTFKDINLGYTPGSYQPGWQVDLHADAIVVNDWATGYNSGVPSASIGYHAKFVYEGMDGVNDPCILFKDWNVNYGLGHRWLGMSRSFPSATSLGWVVGDQITLSWYQKSDALGKGARPGIYHMRIDSGTRGFENFEVQVDVTKVGVWQKASYTQTIGANFDLAATNSIYIYGDGGNYGNLWVDNFQIEKTASAKEFVTGSKTGVISDCSGYEKNSVLSATRSPVWVKDAELNRGVYLFTPSPSGVSQYISIPNSHGKVTDQITVSVWAHRDNWNTASNERIISCTETGGWLLGINDSAGNLSFQTRTNGVYSPATHALSSMTAGWHLVTGTYDGRYAKLYVDGVLKSTTDKGAQYPLQYNATNGIFIGAESANDSVTPIDGNGWVGKIGEVMIYATALSQADITALYQTKSSLDKKGNLYSGIAVNDYRPNLAGHDYTTWVVGTSGAQGNFGTNGLASESQIVVDDNPVGQLDAMWQCWGTDPDSDGDGGWNITGLPVDKTKLYRYSVWVRKKYVGNGGTYWGCQGSTVYNLAASTVNTNPYFFSSNIPDSYWRLIVAYVLPYDTAYTSTDYLDSGVYHAWGTRIGSSTCYKWAPTTTVSGSRSYLYYSTDIYTIQDMYRPRIDLIDGTEPTLAELLQCAEHKPLVDEEGNYLPVKNSLNKNNMTDLPDISEVGVVKGLVAWYPFDTGVTDVSGNDYHGVAYGPVPKEGKNSQCAYWFDGVDDYVDLSALAGKIGLCSISFWGRLDVVKGWLLLQGQDTSRYVMATSGGTGAFYHGPVNSSQGIYCDGVLTTTPAADTNWHHYVIRGFDLTSYTSLYLNNYATWHYNGKIQDLRFYNRILSEEEINILCDMGNGVPMKMSGKKVYINGKIKEVI